MFCTGCGQQNADDVKFCTSCGTPIEGSASEMPIGTDRKKQTQALAVAFAALVIITMLLNGFSMTIRLSSAPAAVLKFLGADSRNINDAKLSFTVSEAANLIGGLNAFLKNLRNQKESNLRERNLRESDLRDLRNLSERDERDLRELRRLRENSDSCGTTYIFINVIKVMMILSVLALLAFIYMIIVEKKNGTLIGQIGLALAFLTSVSFFIFVWWASLASGNNVKISSTLWVYLTIVLSAAGLAFFTVRKNLFRGE